MFWRVTRAEFGRQCAHNGAGNKAAFHALVARGDVPGLLAYTDGRPVGWCSVAPREVYGALERSPKRRRIDNQPVWSIICFYVTDSWRRKGVNSALVQGAIAHVRRQGGTMLEAYPRLNAPGMAQPSDEGAFMGLSEVFRAAGFVEVARPAKSRFVIMRYAIQ